MTPPPAASHADQTPAVALSRPTSDLLARALGHLLDARSWSQLRLLVDLVTLYLASSAALFAAPITNDATNRWLAACFPLLTLSILRASRSPDDRLNGSLVRHVHAGARGRVAGGDADDRRRIRSLAERTRLRSRFDCGCSRWSTSAWRDSSCCRSATRPSAPRRSPPRRSSSAQASSGHISSSAWSRSPATACGRLGSSTPIRCRDLAARRLSVVPVLGTPLDLAYAVRERAPAG